MFIGYQRDEDGREFIAFAGDTREKLQIPCVEFSHVERSEEDYALVAGNWVLKEEAIQLQKKYEDKQKLEKAEAETGLTRAVRELVLAEKSGVSDYVRQQAQEIETLAEPLREAADE